MPASSSSSELSSHQMAIRSHPRVQKNARLWHFIRAERSSNGSCRSHRALEGSSLPSSFCPFVFLLRRSTLTLRLGDSGSWRPSELYVVISTSLRTQVRPAIEFVSGKEGLRPRFAVFVSGFCSLRVQVFLEFAYWDTLKFARAPGLSGGRGEMAMALASSARLAFLRGAVCAYCAPYTRCFPFLVPLQRWSIELPATTVGACRRRHSL